MIEDLRCPACDHWFNYDGDYEGFTQDCETEHTCPKCKVNFTAYFYWAPTFIKESLISDGDKTL